MGIVYLAKDPLIGRLVALKTIRPAAHSDDDETKEFQQRFVREAQAAGILNHPSIVTVHDIGQDETSGVSFIAMEYVEGYNLKEVLAQGRALNWEQIGELISQIAEALDFAHSKGIVHRDVKPANIILIEGGRAKITDFGIAKIASGVSNLTTTGQFLGTPNYMAPEQIKGTPVDGRTDIFSLGICLYECLTRRKPFGGDSLTSISYKIVHEPFPPLHDINPQIPEGFEEVVANCLAKDPAKRYQRARDVAAALRAVARGDRPKAVFEPMLNEETQITRDREKSEHAKLPTIELPFPEAGDGGLGTRAQKPVAAAAKSGTPAPAVAMAVPVAAGAGGGSVASPAIPVAAPPSKPKTPREPVAMVMRRTMSNVRAYPLWRRRIPYNIAIGAVAAWVAILSGTMLALKGKEQPIPVVDTKREAAVAKQRQLRLQGQRLIKLGQATDAHATFEELYKLAPKSPYVIDTLQKLSAIRTQEEMSRQQIVQAAQQRDQGIALFNEKKFTEAIAILQSSFSVNPSDEQTANYLKLAQEEEQKALIARQKPKTPVKQAGGTTTVGPGPTNTGGPTPSGGGDGGRAINNAPATLTTFFNSPFNDGYITVKVGSDLVTNEMLWEEKRQGIIRRRVKVARTVNAQSTFSPRNTDVIVSVVVPSMKISDQKVIPHNFQPGSSQRLVVSFNPATKTFDYQFN